MCWLNLAQDALKLVEKWVEDKKNKKADEKQKNQINCHKKDLNEVIYKMDHDVPKADLEELGHIRGFVVEKQGNLAKRTLIPVHIRNEGNAAYSASLSRIDGLRNKFLRAA